MKRLLMMIMAMIMFLMLVPFFAQAETLQWDYPSDWDSIDGYIIYFNDGTQYNNSVLKADLTEDGVIVSLPDFEQICKMQYNTAYNVFITGYNVADESGPSDVVPFTREGFVVPADILPSGSVITIPNAAITINIQ